jgi:flagellar M-ring protein FliF
MTQIQQLAARLTWSQRIGLLTAVLAVGGGLMALQNWNKERGFRPLFSGMAPEDAGAVTAQLRESQIDYRLTDGGSTILVPEERTAEVRLQLAAAGLPHSGRMGFELFDQNNFGASEFTEQVNYHRAIEGELERSVMSIREVERARVHVTLPKDSLYKESRQPAKASVLVKLRPGADLTAQNITAIAQLTASAVPGLRANQVTIVDTSGNLLSRPRPAGLNDDGEAGEAVLEYRKGVEREIQGKIAQTLEPLLGADHFRIGVSADLDLTSGEQSEEIFDPEKSVMVSSQTAQDVPGGASAVGGVPGTASNLPRAAGSEGAPVSTTAYGRLTENVSYQTSRVVRHTRLAQGSVKRLSLSILVDHTLRFDQGQRVVEPPPAEQIQVIRDVVSAAVGLDTERGDLLVVEAFPFEATRTAAQPQDLTGEPDAAPPAAVRLPAWLQNWTGGRTLVFIGIAAGVAAVAGGLLFWARRHKKPAPHNTDVGMK